MEYEDCVQNIHVYEQHNKFTLKLQYVIKKIFGIL